MKSLFNKVTGLKQQTPTQGFSCEICETFKNNYIEEHLRTTASKHRSSFLEVFCTICCSALINVVMKFSFWQQWFKPGQCYMQIYSKFHSITGIFQGISPQLQNSDIEKCILMAASEGDFNLETFLHGCFSRAAANIYLF